jgi:hypothetical protein
MKRNLLIGTSLVAAVAATTVSGRSAASMLTTDALQANTDFANTVVIVEKELSAQLSPKKLKGLESTGPTLLAAALSDVAGHKVFAGALKAEVTAGDDVLEAQLRKATDQKAAIAAIAKALAQDAKLRKLVAAYRDHAELVVAADQAEAKATGTAELKKTTAEQAIATRVAAQAKLKQAKLEIEGKAAADAQAAADKAAKAAVEKAAAEAKRLQVIADEAAAKDRQAADLAAQTAAVTQADVDAKAALAKDPTNAALQQAAADAKAKLDEHNRKLKAAQEEKARADAALATARTASEAAAAEAKRLQTVADTAQAAVLKIQGDLTTAGQRLAAAQQAKLDADAALQLEQQKAAAEADRLKRERDLAAGDKTALAQQLAVLQDQFGALTKDKGLVDAQLAKNDPVKVLGTFIDTTERRLDEERAEVDALDRQISELKDLIIVEEAVEAVAGDDDTSAVEGRDAVTLAESAKKENWTLADVRAFLAERKAEQDAALREQAEAKAKVRRLIAIADNLDTAAKKAAAAAAAKTDDSGLQQAARTAAEELVVAQRRLERARTEVGTEPVVEDANLGRLIEAIDRYTELEANVDVLNKLLEVAERYKVVVEYVAEGEESRPSALIAKHINLQVQMVRTLAVLAVQQNLLTKDLGELESVEETIKAFEELRGLIDREVEPVGDDEAEARDSAAAAELSKADKFVKQRAKLIRGLQALAAEHTDVEQAAELARTAHAYVERLKAIAKDHDDVDVGGAIKNLEELAYNMSQYPEAVTEKAKEYFDAIRGVSEHVDVARELDSISANMRELAETRAAETRRYDELKGDARTRQAESEFDARIREFATRLEQLDREYRELEGKLPYESSYARSSEREVEALDVHYNFDLVAEFRAAAVALTKTLNHRVSVRNTDLLPEDFFDAEFAVEGRPSSASAPAVNAVTGLEGFEEFIARLGARKLSVYGNLREVELGLRTAIRELEERLDEARDIERRSSAMNRELEARRDELARLEAERITPLRERLAEVNAAFEPKDAEIRTLQGSLGRAEADIARLTAVQQPHELTGDQPRTLAELADAVRTLTAKTDRSEAEARELQVATEQHAALEAYRDGRRLTTDETATYDTARQYVADNQPKLRALLDAARPLHAEREQLVGQLGAIDFAGRTAELERFVAEVRQVEERKVALTATAEADEKAIHQISADLRHVGAIADAVARAHAELNEKLREQTESLAQIIQQILHAEAAEEEGDDDEERASGHGSDDDDDDAGEHDSRPLRAATSRDADASRDLASRGRGGLGFGRGATTYSRDTGDFGAHEVDGDARDALLAAARLRLSASDRHDPHAASLFAAPSAGTRFAPADRRFGDDFDGTFGATSAEPRGFGRGAPHATATRLVSSDAAAAFAPSLVGQHQQHMRPGATSVAFGRGATVMVPAPTRDDADAHTRGTPPRATAAPQQLLAAKRPPLATTSSPFGHGSPSRQVSAAAQVLSGSPLTGDALRAIGEQSDRARSGALALLADDDDE